MNKLITKITLFICRVFKVQVLDAYEMETIFSALKTQSDFIRHRKICRDYYGAESDRQELERIHKLIRRFEYIDNEQESFVSHLRNPYGKYLF